MSLQDEINKKRKDIIVDSYPMSIGEVMNLYRDGEIDIHPEFQRVYRWEPEQKSNLIESILLGIPIPPIFVAQRTSGKWDVIDGQQRLSTIFQFTHILRDDDDQLREPLVLQKTKFLPSLEGVAWENEASFSSEQRVTFKREKLNFTIIKESGESDDAKYELFQRLNTGGTHLSPQEIRNCLLIMINRQLYLDIVEMSQNENFSNCFPLTDSQQDERQDLEFVVRFLVYRRLNPGSVDKSRNMDNYLTNEIESIAKITDFPIDDEKIVFDKVFNILNEQFGENTFKKYKDNRFAGSVLISAFEAIIPGLSENIDFWVNNIELLKEKIFQIYNSAEYVNATRRGIRPMDRMGQLIEFSRRWFSSEN